MRATRTTAAEIMDGKYRFHYKTVDGGGRLWAAGEALSLLEAQAEASRWEAANPGMTVYVVRHGRFVTVDEEIGELRP